MKRIITFLIAIVLAFSFVGCGKKADDSAKKESKKIKIGFAQMCNDVSWKVAETNSVKEEAAKRDYEIVFTDAQWKTEKQVSDIEDLITKGVDYILLAPNDYEGYESALESAKKAKIPVIVIDREIKGKVGEDFVTCVSSDFVLEGEECAKWLQNNQKGAMKIVEITGTPGASVTRDRAQGFKNIVESNKDMQIITSQVGDFDRGKAEKTMTNIIQSTGGKFDAVYCHDDNMAIGVIKALEAAGIKPNEQVKIVAIDGTKEAKEAIQNGKMSAVVTCSPYLGPDALKVIDKLIKGEKVEGKITVKDTLYDKTNISSYTNAF